MAGTTFSESIVEEAALGWLQSLGYTKELYRSKCDALFEHVYESYMGEGGSVYVASA